MDQNYVDDAVEFLAAVRDVACGLLLFVCAALMGDLE